MEFKKMVMKPYMQNRKRGTDVKNRLLHYVGEGNGILLSYIKEHTWVSSDEVDEIGTLLYGVK